MDIYSRLDSDIDIMCAQEFYLRSISMRYVDYMPKKFKELKVKNYKRITTFNSVNIYFLRNFLVINSYLFLIYEKLLEK